MRKQVSELTSNQYYGGLNRRFDRRYRFLVRLGFKRVVNEWGHFLTRHHPSNPHRADCIIPAAMILDASNVLWRDELSRILKRGNFMVG